MWKLQKYQLPLCLSLHPLLSLWTPDRGPGQARSAIQCMRGNGSRIESGMTKAESGMTKAESGMTKAESGMTLAKSGITRAYPYFPFP